MLRRLSLALLIIIACVTALVALFYAEENWRGKHAWEKYKYQREAKSDNFELSSVVPPLVPDDQNFATTPLFAELFPKPPQHPRLEAIQLPACTNAWGNWLPWHTGDIEDLTAWQECLTNTDLLAALSAALSKDDPILNEIAQASLRPYCRFPIRYEDGFNALLPHLRHLRNLAKIYHLRALAELATERRDAAFEDVQMGLRLADTIKSEPLVISFLVRLVILDTTTQPVWEGLVTHRWNESQLAALQARFEKIDRFGEFANVMHGERILTHQTIDRMRVHPLGFFDLVFKGDAWSDTSFEAKGGWLDLIVPSGWFYQNYLRVDRYYTEDFLHAIDWQRRVVHPQEIKQIDQILSTTRVTPYTVLYKILAISGYPIIEKMAASQTYVDEAAVACAIERYRLVHGESPDTLQTLVPEFLASVPDDVIDDEPLRYRRLPDNQYVLYSIGWNEKDDGGHVARNQANNTYFNEGDWVWFSQPQPSASERK